MASKAKTTITFTSDEDQQLFAALKATRLELAREQNVPPYVIFHDKTLRELAVQKPTSLLAMSRISGVGEAKIEHYGQIFLEAIARHRDGGLCATRITVE